MDKSIVSDLERRGAVHSEGGEVYRLVYFANGFTKYKPYQIACTSVGPAAVAPAASLLGAEIGVPQGDTTAVAGWYDVLIEGHGKMLCDGTADITAEDFLQVLPEGVAAVTDGTSETADSCGIAGATHAANSVLAIDVYLLGKRATCTAAG